MPQLDKFQQLASDAQFAVAVLGNLHTGDLELVNLGATSSADEQRGWRERRLGFIGVVGLIDGVPEVALAEVIDAETLSALSRAFARCVRNEVNARLQPSGDGVEWLKRLYSLPDEREN